MTPHRWLWRARYVDNHDGDTVTMDLDVGFRQTQRVDLRVRNLW